MTKITGSAIAAATLALTACAASHEMLGDNRKCNNDRTATVSVEDDRNISVSPEPIYVCKPNAKITWVFASDVPAGYTFADLGAHGKKGIAINDPGGQFSGCRVEANGARYSCMDRKSDTRTYKYVINLVKPDGSTIISSPDPNIVNQ